MDHICVGMYLYLKQKSELKGGVHTVEFDDTRTFSWRCPCHNPGTNYTYKLQILRDVQPETTSLQVKELKHISCRQQTPQNRVLDKLVFP
jgi:hypothetical protein